MKNNKRKDYVSPENSTLEFENLLCQESTHTSDFEDGGSLSGEWK